MIKAGDKVSFKYKEKCFIGTIIIIYNYKESFDKRLYFIYLEDSKNPEIYSISLSDKDSLEKLNSDIYQTINDIGSYAHKEVLDLRFDSESDIVLISSSIKEKNNFNEDGCKCRGCQQFIQYAAVNQPDNTFLCYSCKSNPIRNYY